MKKLQESNRNLLQVKKETEGWFSAYLQYGWCYLSKEAEIIRLLRHTGHLDMLINLSMSWKVVKVQLVQSYDKNLTLNIRLNVRLAVCSLLASL